MKASVDGIEDGSVRLELEDRSICILDLTQIPFEISRGDILVLDQNNQVIAKDDDEKRKRIDKIRRLREMIFARQRKK